MIRKVCLEMSVVFLICLNSITFVYAQEESKMPYNFSASAVNVDPYSGSASSSVPIEVPQGRNGIQPNISLIYNSSLKNGMLGVGWTVEFGSIMRSVKKGVPNYNESDEFLLIQNGSSQELAFDSSIGFYRSKIEGAFMKTEFKDNYWVVKDRNNISYFFGETDASRISDPSNVLNIFKWCLDRVEDKFGNYMEINYVKEGNNLYPKEIRYTGNSKNYLQPHASVEFDLEARGDKSFSYIAGFKIETLKRIKTIKVFAEGNLQRRYEISYAQSQLTKRSLLRSVKQIGSDGISSLPERSFVYKSTQAPGVDNYFSTASGWDIPRGINFSKSMNGRNADYAVRVTDVNGDSFPDIIRNYRKNGQWKRQVKEVYLNNKNNGWTLCRDWSWPDGIYPFLDVWPEIDREWGLRFADVNGDNYIDLVRYYKDDNWAGGGIYTGIYINNKEKGWSPDNSWNFPLSPEVPIVQERGQPDYSYHDFLGVILADVNGDGYVDYVKSKEGYDDGHLTFLNNMANDGKGFTRDPKWDTPNSTYTNFAKGATLIDINGDNLPDILYLKDNVCKVFMNTGKGWAEDTSSSWRDTKGYGDLTDGYTQFVDLNGDGMPDMIVANGKNNSTSAVLINTGNGWEKDNNWLLSYVNFKNLGTRTLDANSDGAIDFLTYYNYETPILKLNNNNFVDLLIEINNGFGGRTKISYASSSQYENAFLPFAIPVVKKVSIDNGVTGVFSQYNTYSEYSYSKGLWAPEKKDFRGFGEVKVQAAGQDYILTTYLQDETYKGMVDEQKSFDVNDKLYSYLKSEWGHEAISSDVNFIFLKRQDKFFYDGDEPGKRVAEEYSYDGSPQFGNLTRKVNYGEVDLDTGEDIGNDKYITETEYQNNTQNDEWILGLSKSNVVKDADGDTVSKAWFYYDYNDDNEALPSKGLLTKKMQWAGDGPEDTDPVSEFGYDTYGNLVTTKDPMGNVTKITYDPDYHMFPLSSENALSQKAFNEYYGVNGVALNGTDGFCGLWGELKTTMDANGKEIRKKYDNLGRLTAVISPLDSLVYPTQTTKIEYFNDYMKTMVSQRIEHNEYKTLDTVSYYDGLRKLIETKTRSSKDGQYIVSGQIEYNSRGLPEKQYLPYFTSNGFDVIDPINLSDPYSTIEYDSAGRPVKNINPDGTYSTVEYDGWTTTTIDENGHMQKAYVDAYGRLVNKEEYLGADGRSEYYPVKPYTLYSQTLYRYDTLGNLIETEDAYGNITFINYDKLGRKVSMNDPDMGFWQYGYDLNGNLTWQMDAKGKRIDFHYDALNRLINKNDHGGGEIYVDYVYDDDTVANSKGRLTSVNYMNGTTQFNYDNVGREVNSIKLINDKNYKVGRSYDALDRLKDLQYPDTKGVKYKYNDAGQIESIIKDDYLGPQTFLDRRQQTTDHRLISKTANQNPESRIQNLVSSIKYLASNFYNNFFEPYILGVGTAYAGKPPSRKNPPLAPALSIVSVINDQVKLQWTDPGKCNGYYLKYGNASGQYGVNLDLGNMQTFTVTGLIEGRTYYFVVNAYNRYGTSEDSNEVSATIQISSNQPPTVNAGLDKQITLPDDITLNATVSDDGLPNPPGNMSVQWSIVSGQGSVEFSNAASTNTTASFSEAGNYVLRITANDSSLSSYDDVTITVNAQIINQPPTVNAGLDKQVTLPDDITLNAMVSDDGLPNPPGKVSVKWSVVSGQGNVEFSNAASTNTTASFSEAGSYVLRITANDGELAAQDTINITVNAQSANMVDLEIVLAVDASGSVSTTEFNYAINGYADTFDPSVNQDLVSIILSGTYKAIAVSLFLFSEGQFQLSSGEKTWWVINDEESAAECANAIRNIVRPAPGDPFYLETYISSAITFASGLFDNGMTASRQVINVSGEGTDDTGENALQNAVSNAIASGIDNIDAISVETDAYPEDYLFSYYEDYVLGGSNPYAFNAPSYAEFGAFAEDQIEREISNNAYDPLPAPVLSNLIAGDEKITLKWQSVEGAKSYIIKYRKAMTYDYTKINAGNVTQYTITGLENGTRYWFTLCAYDDFQEGEYAIEEYVTPNPQYYVKNIDYNINGQTTRIEYVNGVTTEYEYYDLTFRLKRIHTYNQLGDELQDLNYTYDPVGNILSIEDNINTATQAFKYDELNRLVSAQGSYGVKNYVYDELGNIVVKDNKTYYYGEGGAGPHAVTTTDDGATRTTYTYDDNGNMQTKQVNSALLTQYVYGPENRLKEVIKDGVKIALYDYDGDGGRTKETRYNGYTSETSYFVGSLFEKKANTDTDYIFLGSTRIAAVKNDNVLFYHGDHLGGTNVVTDSSGKKKEVLEYEPFGKIFKDDRFGTDEEIAMYQFTSKRFNNETGLYFFESRYYDPDLGRFITADDVIPNSGNSKGFNRYSYVYDNPVNLVDDDGYFPWLAFAIGAIIGGASSGIQSYQETGKVSVAGIAFGAVVGGISGAILSPATTASSLQITAFPKTSMFLLKTSAFLTLGSQVMGAAGLSDVSNYMGKGAQYSGYAFAGLQVGVGIANWIHDPRFQNVRISGEGPANVYQSNDTGFINGVVTSLDEAKEQARIAGATMLSYQPTSSPVSDLTEAFLEKITFTGSVDRQIVNSLNGLKNISLKGFSQGGIVASNVALSLGLKGQRNIINQLSIVSSQVSQVRVAISGAVGGGLIWQKTVTYGVSSPFDFSNALGPNIGPNFFTGIVGLSALPFGVANHRYAK